MSHRGAEFMSVAAEAEADLRRLLDIPDDYAVLFLSGGATTQQALIPLNFASPGQRADYVVSGHWGKTAVKQAGVYVDVNIAASSEAHGYRELPARADWQLSRDAAYVQPLTDAEVADWDAWAEDVLATATPAEIDAVRQRMPVGESRRVLAVAVDYCRRNPERWPTAR
jgi:phosphoserine aminotransferase